LAGCSATRTSCAGAWPSSTVAGLQRMNLQGNADQQAQDLLQAMRLIFPEAVILVREAREGFGST
jgi:hypothetical protein